MCGLYKKKSFQLTEMRYLAESPLPPPPDGILAREAMSGLSELCFNPGVKFEALVSQQFGCPVSPISPHAPSSFHLVASFGRSTVRLNIDSVSSLILQACLGGNAKDYNITHLSGWMFQFLVSCKNVGFMIHNL